MEKLHAMYRDFREIAEHQFKLDGDFSSLFGLALSLEIPAPGGDTSLISRPIVSDFNFKKVDWCEIFLSAIQANIPTSIAATPAPIIRLLEKGNSLGQAELLYAAMKKFPDSSPDRAWFGHLDAITLEIRAALGVDLGQGRGGDGAACT